VKELQEVLREARSLPNEFTALATVVRTAGSSYRRPGARLLVPQDGKSIGAISGGCFGGEVVLRARAVLDSGAAQLIALDTRALFGCDGLIEILIERLPRFSETIASAVGAFFCPPESIGDHDRFSNNCARRSATRIDRHFI
jgi:xanthine/CO dehydrogenase XdhC/CoxF family maturation factor